MLFKKNFGQPQKKIHDEENLEYNMKFIVLTVMKNILVYRKKIKNSVIRT